MTGSAAKYAEVNSSSRLRVSSNPGHCRITCSKVSDIPVFLHVFKRQKPPRLFDQNLHNLSVLYRPVRKIAWIRAAFAWYGLPSSEAQMGWGVVSERYCGWRYSKEGRSLASFDSFEWLSAGKASWSLILVVGMRVDLADVVDSTEHRYLEYFGTKSVLLA